MPFFIEEDDYFEIKIRFKVRDIAGVKIIKEDSPTEEDERELICYAKDRDSETFSTIIENATVIRHTDNAPVIRTKLLNKYIMLNFIKSWNFKDEQNNIIPINNEIIAKTHYNIIRAICIQWLKITSGR